jgi:hypothetical protein
MDEIQQSLECFRVKIEYSAATLHSGSSCGLGESKNAKYSWEQRLPSYEEGHDTGEECP